MKRIISSFSLSEQQSSRLQPFFLFVLATFHHPIFDHKIEIPKSVEKVQTYSEKKTKIIFPHFI